MHTKLREIGETVNTFGKMHQVAHRFYDHGTAGRVIAVAIRNISQIVHGGYIGCDARIDPSVTFVHNGLGVVIHGDVVVGAKTKICQQVTLGVKELSGGVLR